MRRLRVVFFLLLLVSMVTGCASTKISVEDRKALKRVNVAHITLPEKPMVIGDGAGVGFLIAGPIGVAIANGASDYPAAFKEHLAKNKIDVDEIIRSEVKTQLRNKGIEVVEQSKDFDAELLVGVAQYGLTGSPFDSGRFPQIWLVLKLTKPSGDVIWKDYAAAHISQEVMKQVPARPMADYFNDPVLLEKEIRKVTEMVVAEATRSL